MRKLHNVARLIRWRQLPMVSACLGAGLFLTGCTLGPDFSTPKSWAPKSWFGDNAKPEAAAANGQTKASVPVAEPIKPDWWSSFDDPELSALEQRVAKQNLDVRVATIRLAESRAKRQITSADEFPQVNGDASYARQLPSAKGIFGLFSGGGGSGASAGGSSGSAMSSGGGVSGLPVNTAIKPFDLYQYGFDASWEPDLWGRVRRSIEAADANIDALAETRRDTLVSMMAEVARDYIQLRGVQRQLDVSRDSLLAAQEDLRLTKQRALFGLNSQLDINNAAAQVMMTESTVPPLNQQLADLTNQLSFLLGEPPGALASELKTERSIPPVPPRVPIGLPSELAQRRPDIRQAEAQLHAATAQIGVSKAAFYPSITLTGSFDLQALRLQNLGDWASRSYMAGPSISLPIFEGGRLSGNLELTKAEEQEAAFTYQRTVLNAWQEVNTALSAYDKEQTRRESLMTAVNYNRNALNLAQEQYHRGLTTFLDVLSAEQQLYSSELQEANSTTAISTDLVALYKALGGGWETSFPLVAAR